MNPDEDEFRRFVAARMGMLRGLAYLTRVRHALRRLPAGQRAVLVLRFYADFSVDETAEVLGRSPGTITSQTVRGLANLRRLLAAEDIAVAKELEEADKSARYTGNLADC